MNGIVNKLAESNGIDLSIENIYGIEIVNSKSDYSPYIAWLPLSYKILVTTGGYVYYSNSVTYAIAFFDMIDSSVKNYKRISFEKYSAPSAYTIKDITIDFNDYLRVINGSGNFESYCAIFLKS